MPEPKENSKGRKTERRAAAETKKENVKEGVKGDGYRRVN